MEQDCFLAVLSSPLSFRRCKSRTESRNTTQTLPESDEAFRPEPVLQLFQSICRSLELPVTNRPELTDRLLGRNRRRILLVGNRASNRGVHIFPAAPLRVTSTEARARHSARHLLETKNVAESFWTPWWISNWLFWFGRDALRPVWFGRAGARPLPKSFIGSEGIESSTDLHWNHSFPVPGGGISIGLGVAVLRRSLSCRCDCLAIEIRPGQNTFGGERADRVMIYSTERDARFAYNTAIES